jgi:CheY-like chemotaxis protein
MNSSSLIGIVDDDPLVCDALKSGLEDDGFPVRVWSSGEKLLADPELPQVELLLLDWKMRPMDGLKVAERLRDRPVRPIIVMMTGGRVDQIREDADAVGVHYLLQKPLGGKTLSDLVAYLLD